MDIVDKSQVAEVSALARREWLAPELKTLKATMTENGSVTAGDSTVGTAS